MRDGPPAYEAPSRSWLWGVLAVMVVLSFFRACARIGRENATASAPVAAPADERTAFLTGFGDACRKKGNPKEFCDCAGPKLLDNFKLEEIDGVIESTRGIEKREVAASSVSTRLR